MEPLDAVRSCGGAARFTRLTALTPRRALAAAVRGGVLTCPVPGVCAAPDVTPDTLAVAVLRGTRSRHTAAAALGLDLVDPPSRLHVACPPGTRGTWPGTTVHRRDRRDLDGSTAPLDTVLDCLTCLAHRFALVPVDSALRRQLVTVEELHDARVRMNRNDPRRRLITWADPRSGSPLETVARYDLLDAGYAVRTQRVLEPAGRVDFVIDGWLVVETVPRRQGAGRCPQGSASTSTPGSGARTCAATPSSGGRGRWCCASTGTRSSGSASGGWASCTTCTGRGPLRRNGDESWAARWSHRA